MSNALTLDVLLDLIMFDDIDTANQKLAPHHLLARWSADDSVGIYSIFGGKAIATITPNGKHDLFTSDDAGNELEEANAAGVIISSAQEDSDDGDPETIILYPPVNLAQPYESPFRGAVRDGASDDYAMELEEKFRALLTNQNSKLVRLLHFYAHGTPLTNSGIEAPSGMTRQERARREVVMALSGKVAQTREIQSLLDPETLAKNQYQQDVTTWSAEVRDGLTLRGFDEWVQARAEAEEYESGNLLDRICESVVEQRGQFAHCFETVESTSDSHTVNNTMRHAYRVLNDSEKADMQHIKDMGLEFVEFVDSLGNSRELALAKTKIQEAVFWAVNHVTK